jgi:hypothetical protein
VPLPASWSLVSYLRSASQSRFRGVLLWPKCVHTQWFIASVYSPSRPPPPPRPHFLWVFLVLVLQLAQYSVRQRVFPAAIRAALQP